MSGLVFSGFDAGIGNPAVSFVRRTARGYELLAAKAVYTDSKDPLELRLTVIWETVGSGIRSFHPVILGIERQAGANVAARMRGDGGFNIDNEKTLWTCGVAVGAALAYGAEPRIIDPKTAKIAVCGRGYANAEKEVVRDRLQAMFGVKLSLAKSDATALAIAACQLHEREKFGQLARQAVRP